MNAKQPVEKLTISRLARLGGVNLETVRYYEREGLLPRPPRTRSGYRIFPNDAARRLRFIKRAQQLGFSLAEIRELLTLKVRPKVKPRRCNKNPLRYLGVLGWFGAGPDPQGIRLTERSHRPVWGRTS